MADDLSQADIRLGAGHQRIALALRAVS